MTATHRIGELLFDLAFESPAMGIARSEELRSLVVDKLLPLMEAVFDQYGSDDVVRQIDKLVVDVGDVTEAELPAALIAGLRTALEQALHGEDEGAGESAPIESSPGIAGTDATVRREGHAGRASRHRGNADVLLAFLADGTMSWQVDITERASHEILLSRVLANGADAFLQALAASPHRAVMLTRLARQFAPAQLEQLLRKMRPGRADAVLSQLAALQEQLQQDAALTRTARSSALHAAWEAALTAGLDGEDEPLQALQSVPAPDAASHAVDSCAPPALHESPSALVPIRNQVTSALMGGNAGDIYDDWSALRDSQADLLRSAILHYGGYGEIREKMASAFPLSLLLDMEALLSPEAAELTARVWNDEGLRDRFGADAAAQWSHWRRGWWRGAIAYLLPLARARDGMASSHAAASFDITAFAAAALEGAGTTAAEENLADYVMPLIRQKDPQLRHEPAQRNAEQAANEAQSYETQADERQPDELPQKAVPTVSQAPSPTSLTSLFDAIRTGAKPLQASSFGLDQLEQWVSETVREPSFYKAIADHAELARDRRAYYAQVLQALAQNRIVDLEEFAAAEDADLPSEAQQQVLANASSASIHTISPVNRPAPANPIDMGAAPIAPNDIGIAEERDKAQLISRLAKALMKGDPAPLYGDWDVLLHKHAALLSEALRHYGIRDDILQRIVLSFPESMLYDMAVLLAPAAMPAWRKLRDQDAWAAVLEAVSAPAQTSLSLDEDASPAPENEPLPPTPEMLASWKRQLWKAVLRQALQSGHRDPGAIHALASLLAEEIALIRSPWQRRVLMRWADLSAHADVSPQDGAREPLAKIPRDSKAAPEHVEDDIQAILNHRHRLSEAEEIPETVRADLLQRFARIKNDPASTDASWNAADMEGLVEAFILAHGADGAEEQQQQQQRQTFLQAIRTQAPPTPAPARARYFNAVLQALLQEQMLDLEEIAETSKGSNETIAAGEAGNANANGSARGEEKSVEPAMQESESLAHADFLLSPAFRTGLALPSGLIEWLKTAIDTAAREVMPILAKLSGHPEAVARLLEAVPPSSWQKLAALAPYSPLQVQRMRRYAGDVADMFVEQHRQLSALALARFEWRFLLPYLFAPDRIFDPMRFTGEFVGFLSRESGLPVPGTLTSRLRSQMGVAVALPRVASHVASHVTSHTVSHAAAPGEIGTDPNPNPNTSADTNITASRAPQTAHTDDATAYAPSGIHVANAGMVLTWPFLSRAWEALELTREGKFVDDAAAQRAAWLLEFAVNEQTAVPEYQLTLNKLLCGIPLQAPIVPEIEVTQKERDLIEELLTVMITHWGTLGNTSIQGLRQTFLQREGYLSRKEDAWRLQVPKHTFDMLLAKLPWSISTIRLPWMETILWVEWT